MVKHTQTNVLSVFDHFVGLALKGLTHLSFIPLSYKNHFIYLQCKSVDWFHWKVYIFTYNSKNIVLLPFTAQEMKFSNKEFFRKCDQTRSFLWICSHLLKKPFMVNFTFREAFGFYFCVIIYLKVELSIQK